MALVIKDRVKETTTTTGTGSLTLGGAATGFQAFSVIGDGNSTYYAVSYLDSSEWEVGIGTYTASGTTLSRDTILASSNAGAAVNLSAGEKDVYVVYPADKAVISSDLITYVSKTANYTAVANDGVLADTSGGAFTVTLPASPATGDVVIVSDAGGVFASYNLTVGRNGNTIDDLSEDLVLDLNDVSVQFIYDGTTWRYYVQSRSAVGGGADQSIDGGFANSVYTAAQSIDGGSASG